MTQRAVLSADPSRINPISGIVGCCARAASGHAMAVLLTNAMNSRRLMASPTEVHAGYVEVYINSEDGNCACPLQRPGLCSCPLWVKSRHDWTLFDDLVGNGEQARRYRGANGCPQPMSNHSAAIAIGMRGQDGLGTGCHHFWTLRSRAITLAAL